MKVKIDDKEYKVTEKLGFDHSVGHYCYFIDDDGKERMVVKTSKDKYRFWTVQNRFGRQ